MSSHNQPLVKKSEVKKGFVFRMSIHDNKKNKCYVMAILDNPEKNIPHNEMVVYRTWIKWRKRWVWYIEPYWALAHKLGWEVPYKNNKEDESKIAKRHI